MDEFNCPDCGVHRPREIHLDWCQYSGPDFSDGNELDDDDEED